MPDIPTVPGVNTNPTTTTTEVASTTQVKATDNDDHMSAAIQRFNRLATSFGAKVVDGKVDFMSLMNQVNGMKKLEFLLMQAMYLIAACKMDEFVNNMKDNTKIANEALEDAKNQAKDIKEQGMYEMAGAIATGVMQIGASAVSIAGAGMAQRAGAAGGGKFKMASFQASSARWSAASQATSSVGTFIDGGTKYGAAEKSGEAAADSAQATKDQASAGLAKDAASADEKFIEQILQVLMAIVDTQHSVKQKING